MFPFKPVLAIVAASVLLPACDRMMTNHSFVKDTVAQLPSGDEISASAELVQTFGKPDESKNSITWRRAGQDRTLTELRQVGFYYPNRNETQTHVTPDGNHVWLTRNGTTWASFDYDQSLAIIADKGHPAWAVIPAK